RPVTRVAVVRENGPDVAVEVDGARRVRERGRGQHEAESRRPQLRMKYHATPKPTPISPRVATRGLFFSPRPSGKGGGGGGETQASPSPPPPLPSGERGARQTGPLTPAASSRRPRPPCRRRSAQS